LDAAPVRPPAIENPPKRRNLRRQVAVLDDHFRPDGSHDLVLRHEIATPPHQQGEQVERARADGNRLKNAVFARSEQTAGSGVETKAFEQKDLPARECLHAPVSPRPGAGRR